MRFFCGKLAVSLGLISNYGYTDGSGDWYVSVDSEKCNACEKCVAACPQQMFGMAEDDYGQNVAVIKEEHRKKVKYDCAPCHPVGGGPTQPCVKACEPGAIKLIRKPK